MEIDEYSNDSTIGNFSDCDDCVFLLDNEEFEYTPKVEELKPEINNVVSTAYLGCNLNLKNIALKIKNAEFNLNKSSSLILTTNNKSISGMIFSNGKIICTGAKSEKESKSNCIKFSKMLKKIGFNTQLKDFKIQNINASYDIKFKISLIDLYNKIHSLMNNNNNSKYFDYDNNNYCKYNKDVFSGIILYLHKSKISLLIFESGKIVISGAKKRDELEETFKKLYPILTECKCCDNNEK
jgi:transcription initiation factor TFIID TATA-box-binding protein